MPAFQRNTMGLALGLVLGFVFSGVTASAAAPPPSLVGRIGAARVRAQVQSPVHITQSGAWGVEIECSQPIGVATVVDGGAPVTVTGLVWAGAGPVTTKVPYPSDAAARTVGTHTFKLINPGGTIVLADGTLWSESPGETTVTVIVHPDTPGQAQPPKILRWLKILLPLIGVGLVVGLTAWLG